MHLSFGDSRTYSQWNSVVPLMVRGIYAGGYKNASPSTTSKYEYITISSKGNAILTLVNLYPFQIEYDQDQTQFRGIWLEV